MTIDVDLLDLGSPTILGQASPSLLFGGYNVIRDSMVADAVAEGNADETVVSFLPTATQFTAIAPPGFSLSGDIVATKANLKALGFNNLDSLFGASDGEIQFNSGFNFDFDRSDSITGFDFETVAAHEIGHILGFISEVDTVDFLLSQGTTGALDPTTWDLFRFQNNIAGRDPETLAEFTTAPRFLSSGSNAIFDDVSQELALSTGRTTGDGNQASHWRDDNFLGGNSIGLMDPIYDGVQDVNQNDLRVLDLIGYNIASFHGGVVPEPAALWLVLAAGTVVGSVRVRRPYR
ncbi:MAG: hypothetical protein OHK0029_29190 [Armatimonadaceae bacterium]